MNETQFSCAMYASKIDMLRGDLYRVISGLKADARSAGLALPLSNRTLSPESSPLTIALVGQYNAGKSTIIKALTGRSDIAIDSDVCTERTEVYEWNGIQLIDTPGIHAGRTDHDFITYEAIDRADLLVFVVSNELFDNVIAGHFRRLAFERQKARELMLVVNKTSQDPGTEADKRKDIEPVIEPLKLDDLYAAFTDAESFLEAQAEADPAGRRELFRISGISALVEKMNAFVADRGLLAKFTTPVFELRRVADQFANYFSVDATEERMTLELLYRKRDMLLKSRGRVEAKVSSELARAAVAVNTLGDRLAESIKPGITEVELNKRAETIRAEIEQKYRDAARSIEEAIANEIAQLACDVESIRSSPLSQQVRKLVRRRVSAAHGGSSATEQSSGFREDIAETAETLASLKRVSAALDQIGSMVTRWTTGPSAGAGMMSATAVAGSDAHKIVYGLGKFFGVKFAPWGAVHTAQIIGKVGLVLGVVGGILGVFVQVSEDNRDDEMAQKLREARDSVRGTIRDNVSSVEAQFWAQYQSLKLELYEVELAAITESEKTIVGQKASRSEVARSFQSLSARATDLIRKIQRADEPITDGVACLI